MLALDQPPQSHNCFYFTLLNLSPMRAIIFTGAIQFEGDNIYCCLSLEFEMWCNSKIIKNVSFLNKYLTLKDNFNSVSNHPAFPDLNI